jgi:5-methylcytosine-specific restriction endonuclease McrA
MIEMRYNTYQHKGPAMYQHPEPWHNLLGGYTMPTIPSPARKAYLKAWQKANRDKLNAATRRWAARNPEKVAQKKAAQKLKNPTYAADYYASHKEEYRLRGAAYYAANKEAIQERHRGWHKRNPEKSRAAWMRYRARKRNATIGTIDFEAILARDGWICHICGDLVLRSELSFDHVIPLNKGGSHTQDNLAVAHNSCNKGKGDRLNVPSVMPLRIRRRR